MNRNALRKMIVYTVISGLLALPVMVAQGPGRIAPHTSPSQLFLPAGQATELQLCVTNTEQGATRNLQTLDSFRATFGAACGMQSFQPTVTTDSTVFGPINFTVDGGTGPGQVQLTYTGPVTPWPQGDSFCGRVLLQPQNAIGSCRVIYEAPVTNNYEAVSPPLNILSILDSGANGVPAGAIVLSLNGACPMGYARVPDFDNVNIVGGPIPGQRGGETSHVHNAGNLTVPSQNATLTTSGSTDAVLVDDNSGGDNYLVSRTGHTHNGVVELNLMNVAGTTAPAPNQPPFMTALVCEKQ